MTHALVEKGYNVTSLSADIDTDPPDNLHYLYLNETYPHLYSALSGDGDFDFASYGELSTWSQLNGFYDFGHFGCEGAVASTGWHQLLNYSDKFKVITQIFRLSH